MDGTNRIDELEQKFIENPRRYFAPLANEYRKAGNPHQAIAICRAHLAQLPGHMSGQIVYGQALFEGGEYDQAQTVFENALAMDRENLVALRHLGDLALRKGETAAARQWYAKFLEIDPKDSSVIALVGEIDSAAEPPSGATDAEPAASIIPESVSPVPEPVTEADTFHSDEEDKLLAEELGYPVPPAHAFVTETMAELYMAQGFRDRALSVYRQLVASRPEEERLRARLAEIEQAGDAAPVEAAYVEAPSVEDASVEVQSVEETSVEEASVEEASVEASVIVPPENERAGESDAVASEPEPVEPAVSDEMHPEPEGALEFLTPQTSAADTSHMTPQSFDADASIVPPQSSEPDPLPIEAAPPAEEMFTPPQPTVREFFANLGRRKPVARAAASNGAPTPGAAQWNSYTDSSAGADARAATALAGAFGGSAPSTPPGKESEEDVASFRAWLDGLTT